ncbi:hypothetical protein C0J52_17732 [Blattella germanica]|nr:hypothetical protein C0J52_17732 [Blattella germanica]
MQPNNGFLWFQIYPSSETRSRGTTETANDVAANRNRNKQLIGHPVPVHTRNRPISATHAINALSSWQDVSLRVPDSSDEGGPPVPPPRKKKIWREQQLQHETQQREQHEKWKSVPRPPPPQPPKTEKNQEAWKINKKRRQKTLSSVSLPNYNDMSLSVYTPGNEKPTSGSKTPPRMESCISLPGKSSGLSSFSGATVEKIENCVRRCRSFGAFKPEPLKIKTPPMNGRHSSESDDSFDGLDDWDLRVIEHCEAHEISPVQTMLPPQRQRKSNCTYYDILDGKEPLQRKISGFSSSDLEGNGGEYIEQKSDSVKEQLQRKISGHSTPVLESNGYIYNHQKSESEKEDQNIKYQVSFKEDTIKTETELVPRKISIEQGGLNSLSGSNYTNGPEDGDVIHKVPEETQEISMPVVVFDFVNNVRKPQAVVNGYHEPTAGLKTPPPSPEDTKAKNSEANIEDEIGHSSLLRLLKEYQSVDGKLEDTGAQNVLKDLGIPPTLKEADLPAVHKTQDKLACGSRGSSGRSSMTPSLSELEAALSDLLEASAASKTGADEDEDDVMPVSMVTTAVQQSLRVISPKPYSSFSNSFHPIQSTQGKQVAETSA